MGCTPAGCLRNPGHPASVLQAGDLSDASPAAPGLCRGAEARVGVCPVRLEPGALEREDCPLDQVGPVLLIEYFREIDLMGDLACQCSNLCLHRCSPLLALRADKVDRRRADGVFTLPYSGPYPDKTLVWPGDGTLDQHVGAAHEAVVEEPAIWCYVVAVRADLQDSLVELGALLVAHLAHLGHLPPDVVRVPRAEVADVALLAAARVLPLPDLDAPTLDGALCALAGGDGRHVDVLADLEAVGDRNLFPEHPGGVGDLVFEASAGDPHLHQVGDLLRDAGEFHGPGVGEGVEFRDPALADCVPDGLKGRGGVVVLRDVDPPGQLPIEVGRPGLGQRVLPVGILAVCAHACHPHGRDLNHSHRHHHIPAFGGAALVVVHHDDVGHPHLVPCKSLHGRGSLVLRP